MYYIKKNSDIVMDIEKGLKKDYYAIVITETLFSKITFKYPWIFKDFESQFSKEKIFSLFNNGVFISYEAAHIFHQLKNCSVTGSTAQLFIEAKIQELLAFIFNSKQRHESEEISTEIKNKVLEAKKILEKEFRNPPSISELAIRVGTNRTTLKEIFKKLFKTTIYSFVSDVRMGKASSMLINDSLAISDIAYRTGYENQSNFATAFKRKFGLSPKMFRENKCCIEPQNV